MLNYPHHNYDHKIRPNLGRPASSTVVQNYICMSLQNANPKVINIIRKVDNLILCDGNDELSRDPLTSEEIFGTLAIYVRGSSFMFLFGYSVSEKITFGIS